MKKKVIAVVGPTASGKTSLAVKISKAYSGEVISADSMQIYKGMNIATAKPTKCEMDGIRHHLIDYVDPSEEYSVARFVSDAQKAAADIISRGKVPVVCGGTGLYIDSFLMGIRLAETPEDKFVRKKIEENYEKSGGEKMLERLSEFDPETAEKLNPSDKKRIVRSFEIYEMTGETISEQKRKSRLYGSDFDVLWIGLDFRDRNILYDRIDKRVDNMIKSGLVEEAEKYYNSTDKTSSQAIGYKELKPYFDNEKSLSECVSRLKFSTHHYAKRQLTWFRKNKEIKWLYPDENKNYVNDALRLCGDFLFDIK